MACTNFPNTGLVANVTTHTVGEILYKWTGSVWEAVSPPVDFVNNLSLPYVFDTVADMTASVIAFPVGKILKTKGYYTANDGGGADYLIVSTGTGTDDGGSYIDLVFNQAELIASSPINVRVFGCASGIDNATILNKFANYEAGWFIAKEDEFEINDTVTTNDCKYIDMQGKLIYTGTQDRVALDVNGAASSSSDTIRNCYFRLHVESENQSDWTDSNYIGVRITNVRRSQIVISSSKLFTRGVVFRGKGHGFVYNEVNLFELANNQEDVVLSEEEGDNSATGFVNENNFYGGNFLCTTVNTAISRYGIVIETDDTYQNNNNVFHKPSFEKAGTTVTGGAEAVPIVINEGTRNIFRDCRVEGGSSDGVLMRCTGAAQGNIFELGYMNATAGDAGPWQVRGLDNQATKVNYVYNRSLPEYATSFSYPNLSEMVTPYDSTDQSITGGLLLKQSGAATNYYHLNGYTVDQTDKEVQFGSSRGLGIYIDLNENLEFAVSRSVGTNRGRILIQCLTANGAILDDTNGDLVVNLSNASISYTSIYGGGWRYNSDNSEDQVFLVDSSVKAVVVLFVGAQDLEGFNVTVRHQGKSPTFINPFKTSTARERVATQAPDSLSWSQGDKVYNDTPSAAGTVGWVATADIADASVDNTAFKTFGAVGA